MKLSFFFWSAFIAIFSLADATCDSTKETLFSCNSSDDTKDSFQQEPEKPASLHSFSASLTIASDYRFRGISQTMRKPAIQGSFDYAHASGFYLGTFGSNVDGTTHLYNNTSLEWDFYGGIKRQAFCFLGAPVSYDVGFIYYYYPGGQAYVKHYEPYNNCEYYVGIAYKWFSLKFWQSLTNYFGVNGKNPPFNWDKNRPAKPNGNSRYSINIEGSITFDLVDSWEFKGWKIGKCNFFALLGRTEVRHYEECSCTHWRATLTQTFSWCNLFVTYVGSNAKSAFFDVRDNAYRSKKYSLGAQGFVLGVNRSF